MLVKTVVVLSVPVPAAVTFQVLVPLVTASVPLLPWLRRFPKFVTTTEQIGRAMLKVAREGYSKRVLESVDINGV